MHLVLKTGYDQKLEITGIKKLIIKAIDNQLTELLEQNVKLQFFGNISGFGKKVSSKISDAEKKTSFDDPSLVLNIALGYGGRLDIINAVNKILGESKNKNVIIDEEKFFSYLDTPLKDLDLLIRTGGEMRLSNFLLFHIAYTELFFTEKLWPDFTKEDYVNCIDSFSSRDRRFGKEFSKNILKRTPSGLIVAILAILSLYSQSILINQFAISVLIILGMIEILNLTKNKVTLAVASIVMFIVISIITIDLIKFFVLFSALLWILILIAMTFFRVVW